MSKSRKTNILKIKLIAHFFIVSITLVGNLVAQTYFVLPRSAYGIGEMEPKGGNNAFAMGGAHIAYQNDSTPVHFTNSGNPASYASNHLTTAEMAVYFENVNLQTAIDNKTFKSGTIKNLSLTFPIQKWWGSSVGLRPYSKVSYDVSAKIPMIDATDFYKGSGGINQAYWGNAVRPFYRHSKLKGLTMGANASYLFGNIERLRGIEYPGASMLLNSRTVTNLRVTQLVADYGIQYGFTIDSVKGRRLKEQVKITTGFIFGTNTDLRVSCDTFSFSYLYDGNGTAGIKDTLADNSRTGTITIPLKYGVGLGFQKGNRWLLLADYTAQQWKNYKEFNNSGGFNNSHVVVLGGQYVPNVEGGYFRRINYRVGLRYSLSKLTILNHHLTEQAISFGLGLPVGHSRILRSYSMVNIGVEIGTIGTTADYLIKENFFRTTIGFTLNDKWFVRSKYD